jgi:hypothetical protein
MRVDKWHLVALANTMVTEVRQRVTRDQHGRRGTTADSIWVNRRLLLTGAEHLSRKQWTRLHTMLDSCDPTKEIGAAWDVKERLRLLLREREPSKIRWRLADFYDAAIDAAMPETTRLAHTIKTWCPPSLSRSPNASRTPAPKGSTGSSSRPNVSAAATGRSPTISAVSSAISRSPDRKDQQHERGHTPLKFVEPFIFIGSAPAGVDGRRVATTEASGQGVDGGPADHGLGDRGARS